MIIVHRQLRHSSSVMNRHLCIFMNQMFITPYVSKTVTCLKCYSSWILADHSILGIEEGLNPNEKYSADFINRQLS